MIVSVRHKALYSIVQLQTKKKKEHPALAAISNFTTTDSKSSPTAYCVFVTIVLLKLVGLQLGKLAVQGYQ